MNKSSLRARYAAEKPAGKVAKPMAKPAPLDRTGFTRLENDWERVCRRIGPTALAVYLAFRRWAGQLGPGELKRAKKEGLDQDAVAVAVGIGTRTCKQAVATLKKYRLIEVKQRRRGPADYLVRRTDDQLVVHALAGPNLHLQGQILEGPNLPQPEGPNLPQPIKSTEAGPTAALGRPDKRHFDFGPIKAWAAVG